MPSRARVTTKSKRGSAKRIPWGTLSRATVVDTAMRLLKETSYEQLTIRSLASELGTAPMSLYRHVRDKDDLLGEIVERLLEEEWEPRVPETKWRAYLLEACERLRALLVREPAALHVYLRHPVVSPAAVARLEAMVRALRNAGLGEQAARKGYAVLHTYTIGFAALEAGRAGWSPPGDDSDDLLHQLATLTSRQQFNEGLDYLLHAIAHKAR